MSTPHQILGIDINSSAAEIKTAYRKLAMKYHPDRNAGNPEFAEKFRVIKEAYDKLSAAPIPKPNFNGNWSNIDFGSIFNTRQPQLYSSVAKLSLVDVIDGCNRTLNLKTPNGVTPVHVQIPPGMSQSEKLTYREILPGITVMITCIIEDSKNWKVVGMNLLCIADISILLLIAGGKITITHPTSEKLIIAIPQQTASGVTMRIGGKGIKSREQHGKRGDMLIQLDGIMPSYIDPAIISCIKATSHNDK